MAKGRPSIKDEHSVHFKDIHRIINLKVGEFHVVDNYGLKTLRVMLNRYLRSHHNVVGIGYRSVIVSKDKAYFFRVNYNVNLEMEEIK